LNGFYHQYGQFKNKSYFSRIVINQQKNIWVKDILFVEIFYRIKQELRRKAGGGDKRWLIKKGLPAYDPKEHMASVSVCSVVYEPSFLINSVKLEVRKIEGEALKGEVPLQVLKSQVGISVPAGSLEEALLWVQPQLHVVLLQHAHADGCEENAGTCWANNVIAMTETSMAFIICFTGLT
jgi:hypothetical protein